MAIYDTMQFIKPPVSTLCIGQAASMGSLLLCAGAKGMRFATANARIMVHQPSGGFQGQASDIERHAQDIIKMKRRLNEIYVKHTGRDYERSSDALDRDHFMSAEEAKDFGLIDKVYLAVGDRRDRGELERDDGGTPKYVAFWTECAAFVSQYVVGSTGRRSYVKSMLIFDGIAFGGVAVNRGRVF